MLKYFGEKDIERNTTIGVDFITKKINRNDGIYYMQIWDTAGQEKFRSITKIHLKGKNILTLDSQVIVLVLDVNSDKDVTDQFETWVEIAELVRSDETSKYFA